MSAYVVDKAHIDALVRFACQPQAVWCEDREGHYRYLDLSDADWLGRELWQENVRSVEHRYPDTAETGNNYPGPVGFDHETAATYTFPSSGWLHPAADPVAILKACDGLEYQSCEHDGWETSYAYAVLQRIRAAAVRTLPGYAEARWEITADSGSVNATTVGILLLLAGFAYLAAHVVAYAMRAMDTVGGAL